MKVYDYIIVGAGTSGSVLAARLSEDDACSVLLLEAGPDRRAHEAPAELRSPNGHYMRQRLEFYWPSVAARRTHAQEPLPYRCGRGVGGTSNINGQLAVRGLPEDFDGWATAGCRGWAWADVLPAFVRIEADHDCGAESYHGIDGPLPVSRKGIDEWGFVDRALSEASDRLGWPWCPDHNAPQGGGISPLAFNARDDTRVTVNDACLDPARSRTNLHVRSGVLVDRVACDGDRAIGVEAIVEGERQLIRAAEVILCAGAIHSPAILMRSGVGDPLLLHPLGIEMRTALPGVGSNLVDHPGIALSVALRDSARSPSPDVRHSSCCVRVSSGLPGSGRNDLMLVSENLRGTTAQEMARGMISLILLQVESKGRLLLVDRSPEVPPDTHLAMLAHPLDLSRLRNGVELLRELAAEPALAGIAERMALGELDQVAPGRGDGSELDEWLVRNCSDACHACGTCRMGAVGDRRSVVDPEGRVIGLRRLRVADASIIPEVPRANTHLTTVMIADHLAAVIRRLN